MGVCDSYTAQVAFTNEPASKGEINELYKNEPALCKIMKELKYNTGFFCEIKDEEIPFEKAIFTNNHVLDETDIENNKEIEIEYLNEKKYIKMTRDRRKFTNKSLDYTCIEIFKEDNIAKFFEIDKLFSQKKENNLKDIFILQYTLDGKLSHSSGKIFEINENYINYNADALVLSGTPLIKRYNVNYIIGINSVVKNEKNSSINLKFSATPFYTILKDIKEKLYGPLKPEIPLKIGYKNIINIVYDRKDKYESSSHLFSQRFVENNKNNIKLIINGTESQLVNKSDNLIIGINNIQIVILNILTNLECMFSKCESLKNIDELKYLNTEEVTNFSHMFQGCYRLSNIDGLKYWKVSKGENFFCMFDGCSSLRNLSALKNWNVSKANNIEYMFSECSSLESLDGLDEWNISNIKSLYKLFDSCSSLSDIYGLKNWNVSNITNFYSLFHNCSSIPDIKPLENWDVSNGNDFSSMFNGCSSLSDLTPLRKWNVSKAESFEYMFMYCSSIKYLKGLENWDVSNVKDFGDMFANCSELLSINELKYWVVDNGNSFIGMFSKCVKLKDNSAINNWNFIKTDLMDTLFF